MRPQPRYKPGDKIGGRYQVHKALMGGMGEVYLCLDLEERYPYALKTFQRRYLGDPQRLRRAFEREVATWVALEKHPNIVRCFYMDTLDNQPFMLLEWIASDESRGADLRSWLRAGPLDLRLALDFIIDICRGLLYAQEKQLGLVHCDLKPDNILIAQGRLAKITDFGLAQIARIAALQVPASLEREPGRRQSLMGQRGVVGTPAYMAPEQWRGDVLDARTDIYAVGCVLYEVLTGNRPFQAATLDGLRRQHLESDIPKLAAHRAMPGALDELVARCLTKRCEERFSSAGELLEQLVVIYRQEFIESPKALPISDEFTAIDYNNRGATYADLRLYEQALADYGQAIDLAPDFAEVYSNRGATYHKMQRYAEAQVDYNRAIQLDPSLAPIYNNLGATYYEMQHYEKALAAYSSAIRLDPAIAATYNTRGRIYKELQQYDKALADYDRAIQLDPNLALAYGNRAAVHYELQQYKDTLADYDRAIQLDPTDSDAYHNRAITYLRLGRYEDALADYAEFIALRPMEAFGYYNRGDIYTKLQQHHHALADYGQAIALNPEYAEAYLDRGTTLFLLERYGEALDDYYHAVSLAPQLAKTYSNIGALITNLGDPRVALSYFEKAAQLGDLQATQYIEQVRQALNEIAALQDDPYHLAFEFFQFTCSLDHMHEITEQYPFMLEVSFVDTVKHSIGQATPEFKAHFEQRLAWLQQIADQRK